MKKATACLMLGALLIVCLFPVWGRLLPGSGQAITEENRALSRFPDAGTPLNEWPGAVEEWFGDRLAYRRQAVSLASLLQLADVALAVEGENGWLFFLGDGSKDDLLRRTHLTDAEKETIRNTQQQTAALLRESGAAYLIFVCPDKQTVYPEYLPKVFRGVQGASRLDQILPVLDGIDGLRVADTRPALADAKSEALLYYLTDTHWNRFGAWIAFKSAATEFPDLFSDVPIVEPGSPYAVPQGDLARMLNRQEMADYAVDVSLPGLRLVTETMPNPDNPDRNTVIVENPDRPDLPRAVVFQDSFGEALQTYIAACFSRTVFVWSDHVRMDVVRQEQADVVIQEYVERLCTVGLARPASVPLP